MKERSRDSARSSCDFRQECANEFEKKVTEAIAELEVNKDLYHFMVDRKKNRACFSLTFNNCHRNMYGFLKDLTPELFTSMVEVLLHFQQQQGATSHDGENISILNYYFEWKNIQPFRLKILPYSLVDFRSTILHYVQDEKVARTLMSDPSIYSEYDKYESKLKFIVHNIEHSDAFHEYSNGSQQCKFYISRKTHSIIAMNGIDMSGSEHPYYEAYHYARMLETCFDDAVGGVSIGVDHNNKTIWVWADCDEKQFEANVMARHQVTRTGEFQQYDRQIEEPPKPEGCKAVHVKNLDYNIGEKELKVFFCKCGTINRIDIPKNKTGKNKGFAVVHFRDTESADKAMELGNKFLSGRKVRLSYANPRCRRSTRDKDQ